MFFFPELFVNSYYSVSYFVFQNVSSLILAV
uniref:Uncharacterized protein n=1 Tax=Siphoviridae sp. ctC6Q17 TaxID=2827271 RepID=A0A8S5R439_9CAUD|nr:MAG TPA: hypothetical protein [Siphoviridae sp. ctC6Q17]